MNILYIEDDLELAETIKAKLMPKYNIDTVDTAKKTMEKIENKEYDLAIIDYFLPDSTGIVICKKIREFDPKMPILMFTTNGNKEAIVEALDCGADDYLTKPFNFSELEARIRALLRRVNYNRTSKDLILGEIVMDLSRQIVSCNGQLVELSRQEYLLLKYLLMNRNKLVSRQELYEHVWGKDDFYNSNTIDVHIKRIRRKLAKTSKCDYIKSIYGMGYRVEKMNTN